jgi:hypothetical protein
MYSESSHLCKSLQEVKSREKKDSTRFNPCFIRLSDLQEKLTRHLQNSGQNLVLWLAESESSRSGVGHYDRNRSR